MGKVVSCTRIPDGVPGAGRYLCFTDDYKTFVTDWFVRSRTLPPPPPSRICRYPDAFRDLSDPSKFAEAVGVPCRITKPCVKYVLTPGGEVADGSVTPEECDDCLSCVECPENVACHPSWELEVDLMDYAKHQSAFGERVYRQAVFIGRRKAYAAPWGPSIYIFLTMKVLIELGVLNPKMESEIRRKHKVFDIAGLVANERFGTITDIAFNFYSLGRDMTGEEAYEAVLIYWTEADWIARKYAFKLWDLHRDLTLPIVNIMESIDFITKAMVNYYLKVDTLGTPAGNDVWPIKTPNTPITPEVIERLVDEVLNPPPEPVKVDLQKELEKLLREIVKAMS